MNMRRLSVVLPCICVVSFLRGQELARPERDTVYVLSPIIVTATEARERTTPATFSSLTSTELKDRYSVQDVPVLLSELPSVTSYSENGNGIGYNYLNLRGFDQRRLSVMINGVPQNDPEDHNVYWIDTPDLMASTGSIQVQRGAGSAFYGPPAIGGSVNLVTNPFQTEPRFTLESILGFQEFGDSSKSLPLATRKYAASFNSGMVEGQYMFYGRLAKISSDGYRLNSYVDMNSYFLGALRFDKEMTTRFHFFGGPLEDGLAYYGVPKFVNGNKTLRRQNLNSWVVNDTRDGYTYVEARRSQEIENFSQPHYEVIHEWRIRPSITLYTTVFYYAGEGFFDYDASWADTTMLRVGYRYGIPAAQNPTGTLVRAFVGNKQWGWLPRIELEHTNGSLTLGAEVRFHRSIHWGKIRFADGLPQGFDPDYHFYEYRGERDILSLYAHELFRVQDDLTVMADLQFIRNRYGITNEKYLGNQFSVPYFFVNPRLGLNYNMSDTWNGYLSLAYTSREPRMRNLYAAEDSYFGATPQFSADTSGGRVRYDFRDPLAKPERLLNLELGARYKGTDARFATSLFWMEFSDELVKSGQLDIFGQPVTGNAGRSRHLGLEIDGALSFSGNFTVSGNVSLSRNRLVRYSVINNGEHLSLDGNPIAGFPDVLGNFRLTFRDDALMLSTLLKYVGPFYTDNFNNDQRYTGNSDNKNDAYTVLNAEGSYRLPRMLGVVLTVRAEVRNILNNLYFMNGEGNAFFPAAERNYLVGIAANL